MIAWSLWQNRNSCVWNGVKNSAKEVAMKATFLLEEWRAVNNLQQHSNLTASIITGNRESAVAVNHSQAI
ncbi:hypothetical protein A2U01_0070513, partial [Trifolium medium]|nr:hypothetical protein [Trifolium medium]